MGRRLGLGRGGRVGSMYSHATQKEMRSRMCRVWFTCVCSMVLFGVLLCGGWKKALTLSDTTHSSVSLSLSLFLSLSSLALLLG